RFDAVLSAFLGDVHGIFMEDDGIVIGVGNAAATQLLGGPCDRFRRSLVHQGIHFPRLADIPVLTELAREIAPGRAKREDRRAGEEMVQGLLLYGIDAEAARSSVRRQYDLATRIGANKTKPPLPFMQLARPGTQCTFHATVPQCLPMTRGKTRIRCDDPAHN